MSKFSPEQINAIKSSILGMQAVESSELQTVIGRAEAEAQPEAKPEAAVMAGVNADVAEFQQVRAEIDRLLQRQQVLVNRIHEATSWRETGELLGMKESSARYLGGNGSRGRKHTYSSQRGKLTGGDESEQ